MSAEVDVEELSRAIRAKRRELELSLNDVSKTTGMVKSTLSRIERGITQLPGTDHLQSLARWLNIPLQRFFKNNRAIVYYEGEMTPAFVRAALLKDPKLTTKSATALADLFEVAYRGMTEL